MQELITASVGLHLLVIVAAVAGFLVARHIHFKKREKKPFVCPLNFDCHPVVTSQYSKILGIPLEWVGMIYYAIVALSYTFFLLFPAYQNEVFGETVLYITIAAFLFSAYLTYVQAMRIKEWCSLCLFSAFFCTVIFAGVLTLSLI